MTINAIIPLSPKEQKIYQGFLRDAAQLAWRYRGGEAQLNAFYDPLKNAEALIRRKGISKTTLDIEQAFATGAGIPDDQFLSFDDILQRGIDAFNAAANQSAADTESILAFLEQGGAKILRGTNEPDFIPTSDGQLKGPKYAQPEKYKRVFQPRLLWLTQGLESIGVYADDLVIHMRHPDPTKLRQTPYILVEIPRHQKQIILANQRGEITFVADGRFELSMWERLNKYQLKTLPDLTPVVLRDKDIWLNRILAQVQGTDGLKQNSKKIHLDQDLQSPKRNRISYSVPLIIESIQATHDITGEWPHQYSGLIQYGPLANGTCTWPSIDDSMRKIWKDTNPALSARGLTRNNCAFKSLSDLKDKNKLNDDYTVQDIIDSLKATHTVTGKWANVYTGLIEYGPLANGTRIWASVEASIRNIWAKNPTSSCNGLTQENCPYKTLADLKDQNRLNDDYTVQDIIDSLNATHAVTGKWATLVSGVIKHGPLANGIRDWKSVDQSMFTIWLAKDSFSSCNGLTKENCPYISLADLKDKNKLNDDYTVQDIVDSLIATHAETGQWPSQGSGLIEHGPLANGRRTWQSVELTLRYLWKHKDPDISAKGLTRKNCPYTSLARLKEAIITSIGTPSSIAPFSITTPSP